MKKTFVLAFGLWLTFHFAQAQDRSMPGYIVRVSGDTLHGFLKVQGTDESAKQISFKASADDKDFQVYTPDEVKAFQYDGGYLFRAITYPDPRPAGRGAPGTGAGVTSDRAGTGAVTGGTSDRAGTVTRTCFGKLLVAGELDLYTFTEQSWQYFLVRKESTYYLLYDDDLQAAPYSQGNFRSELNFLASGCPAMSNAVGSASYTEGGLRAFFQQLDGCLNPNQPVQSYHYGVKAHSGFLAYIGGMSYTGRSQFTMEARYRLFWPQLDPNLTFNVGVRFVDLKKLKLGLLTDYQLFSIPVTIQYDLDMAKGRIHPFAYAGLSLVSANVTPNNPDVANVGAKGFVLGAGIEVKVYRCLWVRAEWREEYVAQIPTVGAAVILP
jgi:hypothetical protein